MIENNLSLITSCEKNINFESFLEIFEFKKNSQLVLMVDGIINEELKEINIKLKL